MIEDNSSKQINSEKNHKLKKIIWPIHEKQHKEIDFSSIVDLKEVEVKQKSIDEINSFLIDILQFAQTVLSTPGPNALHISAELDIDVIATFSIDDERIPQIDLSKIYYDSIINHISLILSKKYSPNKIVSFGENGEIKEVFKIGVGLVVSQVVSALGHEMYHSRQAHQDYKYYQETAQENWPHLFWRQRAEATNNAELKNHGMDVYKNSLGERSANGFALRFVLEYKKKILAKNDKDRSLIEKLFLSGVDKAIEIFKKDFIKN